MFGLGWLVTVTVEVALVSPLPQSGAEVVAGAGAAVVVGVAGAVVGGDVVGGAAAVVGGTVDGGTVVATVVGNEVVVVPPAEVALTDEPSS